MAEPVYVNESVTTVVTHPNWGSIWAGVFTFLAIWSVFGLLGMAIFATAANPNAPRPVAGMSTGMDIWAVILTIIAMYVAGLTTGKLAGLGNRRDAITHGMIMFGLSIAATLVIVVLGGGLISATTTNPGGDVLSPHSGYVLNSFASLGWAGFVALFLGWLAAMGGASTGIRRRAADNADREMRHAA